MGDVDEVVEEKHSLSETIAGGVANTNVKLLVSLFFMFLFITSNMFIDQVLERFSGAVDNKMLTLKGRLIQGVILVLGMMLLDFVIAHDIL